MTIRHMKACTTAAIIAVAALAPVRASRLNPVSWSIVDDNISVTPGSTVVVKLHANVEDGYHLYSQTTPVGGPAPTRISIPDTSAIVRVDRFQPKVDRHMDPTLGVTVETYNGSVDLPLRLHLAPKIDRGIAKTTVQVRYQVCSSEICLPPVTRSVSLALNIEMGAATHVEAPAGFTLAAVSDSQRAADKQ